MIDVYLGSGFAEAAHGTDSRVVLPVPIVIGEAIIAQAFVLPADPQLVADITLVEWVPQWRLTTPEGLLLRCRGSGAGSTSGIITLHGEFRIDGIDPAGTWELRIVWRSAEPPISRRFAVSRGPEPVRWL